MPNQNGFPVSVGGWIGRSLLLNVVLCIPILGWIAYFVMLAVWAGDQSKEQTFRNWAKAQLWVILIVVGIVLILFLIFGVALAGASRSVGSYRYY